MVGGLLAHHWSRTDDAPRAVAYLQRAAERSFARYAHAEASAMLRDALRHAQRLPAMERERRSVELSLRLVASQRTAPVERGRNIKSDCYKLQVAGCMHPEAWGL